MNIEKNNTWVVELETITPVFIGNGEKYLYGLDYIDGKLVNVNKLIAYYSGEESTLNELTECILNDDLSQFVKKNRTKIPAAIFSSSLVFPTDVKKPVNKFIKNGMGEAYIPGSSIKGALRTAIFKMLAEAEADKAYVKKALEGIENSKSPIKEKDLSRADSDIAKHILGEDPKNNLMKILSVSDSFNIAGLKILESKVFSPVAKTWSIYAEMIPSSKKSTFKLGVDEYFVRERVKAGIREFAWEFRSLATMMNNHARYTLNKHLAYATNHKFQIQKQNVDIKKEYERISKVLDNLNEHEAMIDLGMGMGWLGATGNIVGEIMGEPITSKLRNNLSLATDRLEYEFPKSRKLVYEDGVWKPIGWVKLSFKKYMDIQRDKIAKKEREEAVKRLQEEKIERKKAEVARIAAMSEDERMMEEIAKLTDNNEAISKTVTKCLKSKLDTNVYRHLNPTTAFIS